MSGEADSPKTQAIADENLLGEYKTFMREIFRRLDAISESIAELKSNTSHENNWKNCEFSWSQIRKICEFLTVAIVFAHHCDTGAITALDKWRPKDLLAEASKLSSHPTPVSIAPDFEKDADGHKQIKPLTKPIAPALISEIYGRASEPIHVGSLERILSGKLPPFDVDQIERWIDGFRRLLTNHILLLPGLKKALVWRAGAETEFFILGSDGADFDPTNLPDLEFKT